MIKFRWDKVHRPDQTPIISDEEIENLAEKILMDYKPELLEHPMAVNPEHFAESYIGIDIEYQRIASLDSNVVGAMVFDDECLPVYREDGKIHQLRPKQRELLRKVFWENVRQTGIAKEDGVGKSAISQRLTTICNRLRKYLS